MSPAIDSSRRPSQSLASVRQFCRCRVKVRLPCDPAHTPEQSGRNTARHPAFGHCENRSVCQQLLHVIIVAQQQSHQCSLQPKSCFSPSMLRSHRPMQKPVKIVVCVLRVRPNAQTGIRQMVSVDFTDALWRLRDNRDGVSTDAGFASQKLHRPVRRRRANELPGLARVTAAHVSWHRKIRCTGGGDSDAFGTCSCVRRWFSTKSATAPGKLRRRALPDRVRVAAETPERSPQHPEIHRTANTSLPNR